MCIFVSVNSGSTIRRKLKIYISTKGEIAKDEFRSECLCVRVCESGSERDREGERDGPVIC